MAQHFEDFAGHPVAAGVPAGWTDEWGTGTWAVVADEAATGGKRLTQTGFALAFNALSWDDVGDVADAEIVAKVRVGGTSTVDYRAGVYVRGSSGDADTGYFLVLWQGSQLRLRKIDGANNTPIASASFSWDNNTWYWLRLRAEGSALKAKVWADGDPEPGTWTIETEDASFSSGWVGVGDWLAGGTGAAANSWDVVGVGTGGDPAPTEEPAGDDVRQGGSVANLTVTATGSGAKTSTNGSQAALTAAASAQGSKHATGGETAAATVASEGSGRKVATGGATATATVTATGGGRQEQPGRGGSVARATAATTGAGHKIARGGSTAGATADTAAGGRKRGQGGSLAPLVAIATGGGRAEITTPSGGSVAQLVATAEGAGLKISAGGSTAAATARAFGRGRNPARVIEFTDVIRVPGRPTLRVPGRPDAPTVPARPVIHVPSRTRS